jgi:hypothetical protein
MEKKLPTKCQKVNGCLSFSSQGTYFFKKRYAAALNDLQQCLFSKNVLNLSNLQESLSL